MDSRRRHHHQKPQQPQIPWGFRMAAELDVVCRSKVPLIADLDIDEFDPQSLSKYEYDFVLERQIIADYEQYWDQKRRSECCSTPGPLGNPSEQPLSPRAASNTPSTAISPETTANATGSNDSAEGQPESKAVKPSHDSLQTDTIHRLSELLPDPPAAARHLLSGQVLQPNRTEVTSLSMTVDTPALSSGTSKAPESTLYLQDFDTGADDPFANTELKTINDLEELRNVLLSSPVENQNTPSLIKQHPRQLTPPVAATVRDKSPISRAINSPRMVSPGNSTSFTGKQVTGLRYPPPPPGPTPFSIPVTGSSSIFRPPFTSGQSSQFRAGGGTNTANVLTHANGLVAPPGRSLSSSVPNFESAGLTDRPNSVTGVPVPPTGPYAPVPNKSLQPFVPHLPTGASQQRLGFQQLTTRNPVELDALARTLIDWVKQVGLPETRARGLLQIPQNRARFSQLPLEKAKQQLTEQLRLVQLLMNEYSTVGGSSPRLSEQTAIVAVSAFPYDFLKARQFAKVALDLEQCGHPQEVTQSFLLDARLDHEATLAQFLSALPRRNTLPRPPPGHPSWQPAPLTGPQPKR